MEKNSGINLNNDELFKVTEIQKQVQEKYIGKDLTKYVIRDMSNELKNRLAEAGFESTIDFIPTPYDITIPQVVITGRTDKKLEKQLKEETDTERYIYDAKQYSSKDLKKKGVDLDLLE